MISLKSWDPLRLIIEGRTWTITMSLSEYLIMIHSHKHRVNKVETHPVQILWSVKPFDLNNVLKKQAISFDDFIVLTNVSYNLFIYLW